MARSESIHVPAAYQNVPVMPMVLACINKLKEEELSALTALSYINYKSH